MFKKYQTWYNSKSPIMQKVISFGLNWVYWLFFWIAFGIFFFEENRPWYYFLWMATWMAILFDFTAKLKK